ncbi:MAG: PQQ-binding-like beta-propeller repeat protein [Planctomycetes bacterium]|nr:PQQ-binding-like beta-propeller repeat protein [Planctomycetota bacterium]
MRWIAWAVIVAATVASWSSACSGQGVGRRAAEPLRVLVMDPLSDQIACGCVAGFAQRKYGKLGAFIEKHVGRPVQIAYAEALDSREAGDPKTIDLVIGKHSVVTFDAKKIGIPLRTLAMLTGQDGEMTLTGLFIVRQKDPAKSIADLTGYRILFGPQEAEENHSAAFATLEAFGLPTPKDPHTSPGCTTAAIAVGKKEADAAVISSYAMRLLEGCGSVKKGELRIVGRTDPVPFITLFATDRVGAELEGRLLAALSDVKNHPDLLKAMESKHGFVGLSPIRRKDEWTDWRGPKRQAIIETLPKELPPRKQLLWSRTLTGPGMSGLAVTTKRVIVADKSIDDRRDIWRCLDADTGREIWRLTYPAEGEMDYTNSPRANPVVHDGLVYLLGAFGDLHCVRLDTGKVLWRKHLIKDFGAELPTWGMCSTPLIVGDKLIVNPGAKDAAIVALDRRTGKVLWHTPGDPPAYASFVFAKFNGVPQIIGYEAASLNGWDPGTGKRLWTLVPRYEGDFNVPTPIVLGDKLLVSTENNGTRLYGFDKQGRIIPKPVAATEDLFPDTSTPVVIDGMVFGNCSGLVCLDLQNGLKMSWEETGDPYSDYCSLIAGHHRVLVVTVKGELCLLEPNRAGHKLVSRLPLFGDVPEAERDTWSHPALVGNRLYIRNLLGVYCFLIR